MGEFLKGLRENKTLESLSMGYASVTNAEVEQLANALQFHKGLTHLDLNLNKIAGLSLHRLLTSNNTLTSLRLDSNPITLDGIKTLSAGLQTNSTLSRLSLRNLSLKDTWLTFLIESLRENKGVTYLNLSCNAEALTVAVGKRLATFLRYDTATLTSLDLSQMKLKATCLSQLAGVLQLGCPLTTLVLDHNQLKDHWVRSLSRLLSS